MVKPLQKDPHRWNQLANQWISRQLFFVYEITYPPVTSLSADFRDEKTIPKLTRVHKTLFPIFSRRKVNLARLFLELCEFFYCPDSTVQIDRLCKFLIFWRLIQFYLFCGLRSYAFYYTALISTWNTKYPKTKLKTLEILLTDQLWALLVTNYCQQFLSADICHQHQCHLSLNHSIWM